MRWGEEKNPRKKVDLHGSSWLREQEDNRKRALAQAADGLNRKVNGKCKEHTNRGFRQTRGVYLKHTHTHTQCFHKKKNVLQRKSETWLLKNPTEFKIVYNQQKLQNGVGLWTPPPPSLTQRPFEKPAEFHDFPTRHHSLYWRDARSSGRLSTLDVTKCCTGL